MCPPPPGEMTAGSREESRHRGGGRQPCPAKSDRNKKTEIQPLGENRQMRRRGRQMEGRRRGMGVMGREGRGRRTVSGACRTSLLVQRRCRSRQGPWWPTESTACPCPRPRPGTHSLGTCPPAGPGRSPRSAGPVYSGRPRSATPASPGRSSGGPGPTPGLRGEGR